MPNVYYENTLTNATHVVTKTIASAKWTTKRGSPATLELTVLADPVVQWELGGVLSVRDGGTGLFYGYVFKIERKEGDVIGITAYDQVRYLKNKGTYVFAAKRADEIVKKIADDFRLVTGALINTGYVIPSLSQDTQPLIDIIGTALDHTLVNSGKLYYLWDAFGELRLSDVEEDPLPLRIGDSSLVTGFASTADIDSETYNRIVLAQDVGEGEGAGRVEYGPYQDDESARVWGMLQEYRKVDGNLNVGQIDEMGAQLLYLYNRPKRSFELSALSDLSVRAGRRLQVSIRELGIQAFRHGIVGLSLVPFCRRDFHEELLRNKRHQQRRHCQHLRNLITRHSARLLCLTRQPKTNQKEVSPWFKYSKTGPCWQ